MRIALCFSGQPRNWKEGNNSIITNLIDKYDVDIFGHLWWDKDKIGQTYPISTENKNIYIIEDNVDDIKSAYNFKKILIESTKEFDNNNLSGLSDETNRLFKRLKNKYFSIKQSFSLAHEYEKEMNFEYDWIISSRYDISIEQFPNLSFFDSNTILVDDYHKGRKYIFNDNLWIFGKPCRFIFEQLFDQFDNTYESTQSLKISKYNDYTKDTELYSNNITCGELATAYYLLFNDIIEKVQKTNSLKFTVRR